MKKTLIIIVVLLFLPAFVLAQEHWFGVGIGSVSGSYLVGNTETELSGEMVELPVYTYSSKVGLTAGVKVMEFSVQGSKETNADNTNFSYTQSLLALTLGWNFQVGDKISIAPQMVGSYMGSSRFHYSSYIKSIIYGDYVTGTDTLKQSARLSGYEIPIYYAGKVFILGIKLCAYNSGSEIELPTGVVGEIAINGGLVFVMEAGF